MARRVHSLHHNLQQGQNVPFHREHRSKRGRTKNHNHKRSVKQFLAERRERIVRRRMRQGIRAFINGNGRASMSA